MSRIPPIGSVPYHEDMNRRRREAQKRAERLVQMRQKQVFLNDYEPRSIQYAPHSKEQR